MNNLAQTQKDTKQTDLNQLQEQMIALYQEAGIDERNAILGHLNWFLSFASPEAKNFWLDCQQKLKAIDTDSPALFPLGKIYLTIGAREAFEEGNQMPVEFLAKHQSGDWGLVCEDDRKENEFSLANSFRLLSAYKTANGTKLWVITEADRSSTTILVPSEY
ncbi:MAG TPA: hypothetical protein VF571_03825 [Pyrinomonadaceae bacterium]